MKQNIYKLNNVDCASCGIKLENEIKNLNGVISSNFNFMLLRFSVDFDEVIISDEEIETNIHKTLRGVEIIQKNNKEFIDTYQEESVFKKILFKGRKR